MDRWYRWTQQNEKKKNNNIKGKQVVAWKIEKEGGYSIIWKAVVMLDCHYIKAKVLRLERVRDRERAESSRQGPRKCGWGFTSCGDCIFLKKKKKKSRGDDDDDDSGYKKKRIEKQPECDVSVKAMALLVTDHRSRIITNTVPHHQQ